MAETYNVYWGTDPGGLQQIASGLTEPVCSPPLPLDYSTIYYWRVDAVDEGGTTTGDVWQFTTLVFKPPSEYTLQRRLIVAAKNSLFVEVLP
jgi:hypothetical protein